MVSPVKPSGVGSLLRPAQTPSVNQKANQQVAQAVFNAKPSGGVSKQGGTFDLASANSPPPANLPRGSIVDKLV